MCTPAFVITLFMFYFFSKYLHDIKDSMGLVIKSLYFAFFYLNFALLLLTVFSFLLCIGNDGICASTKFYQNS